MKVIGLTGSIGMGKSVTANLLRRLGVPVHDSDAVVHQLLSPQGEAFKIVAQIFPAAWDKKNRIIDRQKLGEIIFSDPEKKKLLESILHPFVWRSQRQFVLRFQRMGKKRVVLDIPLLYETGADRRCDAVIVVSAPPFIQRLRVLNRPNMTLEKFYAILGAQTPDFEKRRLADVVIETGLGKAFTLQKLKKFLRK
jgi:dephospho-CoA kinase